MLQVHVFTQGHRFDGVAFSGFEQLHTPYWFRVQIQTEHPHLLLNNLGHALEIHLEDAPHARVISGVMTECRILAADKVECLCEPRLALARHHNHASCIKDQSLQTVVNQWLQRYGYSVQTHLQNSALATHLITQRSQLTHSDLNFLLLLLQDAQQILYWDGREKTETLCLLSQDAVSSTAVFSVHPKARIGSVELAIGSCVVDEQCERQGEDSVTLRSNHWFCFPGSRFSSFSHLWLQTISHHWHLQKGYQNKVILSNRLFCDALNPDWPLAGFYQATRLAGNTCTIPAISGDDPIALTEQGTFALTVNTKREVNETIVVMSSGAVQTPLYTAGAIATSILPLIVTAKNPNDTIFATKAEHGFSISDVNQAAMILFHLAGQAVFLQLQQHERLIQIVSQQGDIVLTAQQHHLEVGSMQLSAEKWVRHQSQTLTEIIQGQQRVFSENTLDFSSKKSLDWQTGQSLKLTAQHVSLIGTQQLGLEIHPTVQISYSVKQNINLKAQHDLSLQALGNKSLMLKSAGVEIHFSETGTILIRASQCLVTAKSSVGFSGKLSL